MIFNLSGAGNIDIETGTFTPTMKFGGENTGITYSAQLGVYYKIGQLVYIESTLILESKGGYDTGDIEIYGLPFTPLETNPTPIFPVICNNFTGVAPLTMRYDAPDCASLYTFISDTRIKLDASYCEDLASLFFSGTFWTSE